MKNSSSFRIDLDETGNSNCLRCSNSEARDEYIDNDLCKTALSLQDNLPVRCVGPWGYEKIYRLVQYFGIFSKGMRKKWNGLNYIEICSGSGRCILRNSGKEINGTALAILKHPSFQQYLCEAIFIDYNNEAVDILNYRIKEHKLESKAIAKCIDFNDTQLLIDVLSSLRKKSLNLVLVDPTQCDIPFSSVKTISDELGAVDFIVNVAFGTDLKRNIKNAVLNKSFSKVREKYSRFLGDDTFFTSNKVKDIACKNKLDDLMKAVMKRYRKSWENIGYRYFAEKPVGHYYKIMFVSKHKKGLDFWKKANKYEPSGQMTFDGM